MGRNRKRENMRRSLPMPQAGVDLNAVANQKAAMEQAIRNEVRISASQIFKDMAAAYLLPFAINGESAVDVAVIERMAALAYRAAPYVQMEAGIINIDHEQHWQGIPIIGGNDGKTESEEECDSTSSEADSTSENETVGDEAGSEAGESRIILADS